VYRRRNKQIAVTKSGLEKVSLSMNRCGSNLIAGGGTSFGGGGQPITTLTGVVDRSCGGSCEVTGRGFSSWYAGAESGEEGKQE